MRITRRLILALVLVVVSVASLSAYLQMYQERRRQDEYGRHGDLPRKQPGQAVAR